MKVNYGDGKTEFGPGVQIDLKGEEVVTAIMSYLVARNIHVSGPRTISVNGELIQYGEVYVDPSGFVIRKGKKFYGSGKKRKL